MGVIMKGSNYSLFVFFLIIVVVFSLIAIMPVSAGMKVTGAKIMDPVTPGEVVTYEVKISSDESDPAMDIGVNIGGFGNQMDGKYVFLQSESDNARYSACPFIHLDKNVLHLNPGESETVLVTVTVPKDIGSGGRYAIICAMNQPNKGGGISYSTAILIPVMLTISGSEMIKTGSISDVAVDEITAGQPLTIRTRFENTGNHHYYGAQNSVELRDETGGVVAAVKTEPKKFGIIPQNGVEFNTKICDALDVGAYTAISRVLIENTTVLDEKSVTFEVSEEYVPPFSDCSVIVKPDSPAELATSDGRCSISFPQGSVFGDMEVSLKSVEKDTLPAGTSGVELGTTCFRVEGISGLLSKDATMTVRFLEDDLAVAGGRASRLKLGYYNEAEHVWKAMPTEVNENEMTLTTSTNHFSTWAVLASDSSGGKGSTPNSQEATPLSPILSLVAVLVVAIGLKMRPEH